MFLDIDQLTARGGKDAYRYFDDYTWVARLNVEQDRFVSISAMAGIAPPRDQLLLLRQIKELAPVYGWKGVRWTHKGKLKEIVY